MNLKKVSLKNSDWDLYYVEGEVTADDVTVTEELEQVSESEHHTSISSKIELRLDPEIVEILKLESMWRSETVGMRRIVQHDSCKSKTDRAIKTMKTKHKNACANKLTEEEVQRETDWLVDMANREIERLRTKFVETTASVMRATDGWTFDRQPEIDAIQREIAELEAVIEVKEKTKKAIIASEMTEWITGELDDAELRQEIVEKTGFGKSKAPLGRKKKLRRTS